MPVHPAFILLYVLLSIVVGFYARKRSVGFAGGFVLSLILSPLVMGLALMMGSPQQK
jgi:hypothetical protein